MSRAAKLDTASIARAHRGDDALHIAVTIAPLLSQYKKHGRLSLRVERLPVKARFSKGTRNNDGSWSLATDELEDLVYFLEKETAREHTLAIRIINLSGGNTLAVIEYKVTPEIDAQPEQTATPANAVTDAQVQLLRAQLAEMKAALAARDAELAAAPAPSPAALTPDMDAEIEAVRAELQDEFQGRLAAVGAKAAADLRKQREAWSAELNARVAEVGAVAQQQVAEIRKTLTQESQAAFETAKAEWERDAAERLAAAEEHWRAEAERTLAATRAKLAAVRDQSGGEVESLRTTLEREANEALAATQAAWQTAEAERLATARTQWRQEADEEIAAARSGWRVETDKEIASARTEWRVEIDKEIAAARTAWREETDKELEAARAEMSGAGEDDQAAALKTLRTKLDGEAREALARAEQTWKEAETERLAAARAEWQTAGDKTLAEARAQALQETGEAAEGLRGEVTALSAKLAERDAEILKAQRTIDAVREAGRLDTREAIAKAEAKWKSEEAARLAAAQSQWRAESEKALATAREATFRVDSDSGCIEELREKIAALETTLAEREAALAEAQDIVAQQHLAASQKAQKSRKSEDAERMTELENEWRAGYGNTLAEATARYEAAEAALAQIRIKTKDGGRMAQDLASSRVALAAREKELADLRAKVAPLDGEEGSTPASVEPSPEKPAVSFSRGFVGATIAGACIVALLIVFAPSIETLLFPAPPPPAVTAPEQKADERLAPIAVEELKATLLRETRMRVDPTPTAKVVATLSRGSEVIVLERQDKWVRVRFESAKSLTGWVQAPSLKENAKQ